MKVDLKIKQTFNVKYIYANFGVRYYEDSELNGVEDDSTPPKMPCYDKEDKRWKLTIDVDNGQITNWEKGKSEPSTSQLRKISEASGIPMDYIFVSEQS